MGFGDILQGAAGGALGGSTLGPWGALGGGILGGLAGAFGGGGADAERQRYLREINQRQAPSAGQAYTADYSGFRGNQADLIAALERQSRGEGPSLSREMLNVGVDKGTKQQQAMLAGGGGNQALAGMMASNNAAGLTAQANQDAMAGRIQEQMNARNQLGLALYGARDQDEGMNRFNAGARNQNAQYNASNQLSMYGLNDQARMGMMGNQPSMGQSVLAAGAGLRSWYDAQNANNNQQKQQQPQG